MLKFVRLTAISLVLAVAGCDDSTGPGDTTLDATERAVLASAVSNSGVFSTLPFAPFSALIVNQVDEFGRISNTASSSAASVVESAASFAVLAALAEQYDAVGIQVIFDITTPGVQQQGSFTGVVGWAGLNVVTNTVEEILTAGIFTLGTTPFSSGSTPIGGQADGFAAYFENATASIYLGSSGTFTLNSASFIEITTNCTGSSPGATCQFSVGTMAGSFNFQATRITGTGAATFTQPNVSYNLPALRINLTVTQ